MFTSGTARGRGAWLRSALVAASAAALVTVAVAEQRPHLVHIVIDDLGFHDVGYKDAEVLSPNLDALRAAGVELTNFCELTSANPPDRRLRAVLVLRRPARAIVRPPCTHTCASSKYVSLDEVYWEHGGGCT